MVQVEATENAPANLSPDVMLTVQRQFAPGDQRAVAQLLATYGQRPSERDVEPVRKAILQLANGDLQRLGRLVDLAKSDYDDVLAWASQFLRRKPI